MKSHSQLEPPRSSLAAAARAGKRRSQPQAGSRSRDGGGLSHTRLSRPPLERMLRIHQAIQSGKYPNASTLAGLLEVSTKSIHRDLEFMRDRLALPLEYEDRRHGYYYTQEVASFPTVQVSEGELVALLVAEKAMEQYRGTSFERPLVSAFRKIAASLPDSVSLNLSDWEQSISFHTSAEPLLRLEIFDALAKAATRRQQVRLTYRKPGRRVAEERVVDPYHLANINGEWFLFAHDHLRNDIRTFAPARIQAVALTGVTFRRPSRFSLQNLLRDSFGVHSGRGTHAVVLRFHPAVADYIREKKWHASQELKDTPDGGVELKLALSSLVEVQRWVLSWAGQAVAVAPPELVASVRAAAERILSPTQVW